MSLFPAPMSWWCPPGVFIVGFWRARTEGGAAVSDGGILCWILKDRRDSEGGGVVVVCLASCMASCSLHPRPTPPHAPTLAAPTHHQHWPPAAGGRGVGIVR
ncbi:hypothetical protein Pcinc_044379 [Petrolisthes cinctipes]|uniref:Uncharacterized protein n=1 Tax=Petrolisthes cinctipes TaxID=88211 RepID=A0AAE1EFC7_PETCI|nr:hypothetical protein Pcinc_044379 [Petrolisthes cinctipes]